MRRNLIKIPLILSLIMAVFVLSVFCCCFTETVHAQTQAPVPACHQTHTDQPSSHDEESCQCHNFFTVAKIVNNVDFFSQLVFLVSWEPGASFHQILQNLPIVYQSPPGDLLSTIPLYLKHSVYRI